MWEIISLILAIIISIVGAILAFVLIVPDKKRNGLNKFFKFLHDLFNFKFLTIEKILQVLYIISTIFVIVYGFFSLFLFVPKSFFSDEVVWMGWIGLLLMVLGPIAIRLVFECLMMFVILVKNTNQINNKLGTSYAEEKPKATKAKKAAPAPAGDDWFCTQCGTKNGADGVFCNNCGTAK